MCSDALNRALTPPVRPTYFCPQGSATILDNGTPALLYTCAALNGNPQRVCLSVPKVTLSKNN